MAAAACDGAAVTAKVARPAPIAAAGAVTPPAGQEPAQTVQCPFDTLVRRFGRQTQFLTHIGEAAILKISQNDRIPIARPRRFSCSSKSGLISVQSSGVISWVSFFMAARSYFVRRAFSSQRVKGCASRHGQQPAGDGDAPADGVRLFGQDKENALRDILGEMLITHLPPG